jgi:hypothetical protein
MGPVERVLRALALDSYDVTRVARPKVTEHGIGELAVDLDELLSREGVPLRVINCSRVTEYPAKHVGEKVREELLLLEGIGLDRTEERSPPVEHSPHLRGSFREAECR